MATTDQLIPLEAANARKQQLALTAARDAIAELQRSGSAVSFAAVAATAGVSRNWLYNQPHLRELIGRLRSSTPPPAIDAERAGTESLRRITDALRLELDQLRHENKNLKDQLARQLGIKRSPQNRTDPVDGEDMSSPSSPTTTRASTRSS